MRTSPKQKSTTRIRLPDLHDELELVFDALEKTWSEKSYLSVNGDNSTRATLNDPVDWCHPEQSGSSHQRLQAQMRTYRIRGIVRRVAQRARRQVATAILNGWLIQHLKVRQLTQQTASTPPARVQVHHGQIPESDGLNQSSSELLAGPAAGFSARD